MNLQKVIAEKLSKKVETAVGHRVDMAIADYYKINSTAARFMIEYDGKQPSSENITDFFIRKFGGKVTPDMTTAQVIPAENVIVVVASMVNYHRPISDANKMVPVIAGCTYYDQALAESWEVKDVDGTKVLARKVKDDIASIVEARRKVMMDKNSKKTFASLKATAIAARSVAMVSEGDVINAYHNGRQYDARVVSKVTDTDVEFKIEDGKTLKVDKSAVLEVVARAEDAVLKDDEKLVAYYTKAFGDAEYAKKLVYGK